MNKKRFYWAGLLCLMSVISLYGQDDASAAAKSEYSFKLDVRPEGLAVNDYGVCTYSGEKVYTVQGREIAEIGSKVIDMQFNPAGIYLAVLSQTRRGTKVELYNPNKYNTILHAFNNKKLGQPADLPFDPDYKFKNRDGNPTAITFTPDARRFLIAAGDVLNIFDMRKFELVDSFTLPVEATKMTVSRNNYYLAVTDGRKVVVYNFEDKRIRKEWELDVDVTALEFSKDDSMFAILTEDGFMSIYDTANFLIKKNIDDLGEGIDGSFDFDGKYFAVGLSEDRIAVVNLLKDDDRDVFQVEDGGLTNLSFIVDYNRQTPLLAYNTASAIKVKKMANMEPFYGKLIADEVNERMNEWLKMMPGETMEEYNARVNDETRARQMRLFEEEISTRLAGDMLSMASITLGKYDRGNGVLTLAFDNMPTIYLPVPENDLGSFTNTSDLEFSDTKYGVMANDEFELIYARIHNRQNGKDYIYDNLDREPLNFIASEDNYVSLEIIQQQQMETLRLEELRQKVIEEAKMQNVISDHTHIAVASRVVPDTNADGERILNYQINFSYQVESEFSAHEDFAPGKYVAGESGAASSMLSIVKQAFEGDFAQYCSPGKKLLVKISGTADSAPIRSVIPYNGIYGDFENELVYQNGQLGAITVTKKGGIRQNEQLAFLRAAGVRDFLEQNVEPLKGMNADYQYFIDVAQEKGGEFRRITVEFTLYDVF